MAGRSVKGDEGSDEETRASASSAQAEPATEVPNVPWAAGPSVASPQRPYKSLESFDWSDYPAFEGKNIKTDGNKVVIHADSREEALNIATNVIAIVPGGNFDLKNAHDEAEEGEDPSWLVVLERKE